MQAITPVTHAQLLAAGQQPLMKVEIEVGADNWINLNALDAKNYVESASISLGGAGMSPNPIGGTWSALLSNENSIFHLQHPTSAYKDYFKTGRKTRISIGATYGGTEYLWQRIIGYIDEPRFEAGNQKVSFSGADYMKLLQDTQFQELDATHPNHWGLSTPFDSWPSDGELGDEIYNPSDDVPDAGDAMEIGTGEGDRVTDWTPANCTFTSEDDVSGGSTYVGRMVISGAADFPSVKNSDVGNVTEDKIYKVKFKYIRYTGSSITVNIFQNILGADVRLGLRGGLSETDWTDETIYFTAQKTDVIEMWINADNLDDGQFRIDQISIWEYKPEEDRYYDLAVADADQKGPYHVTYNDNGNVVPVQQGEEDEGWWFDEAEGHVFFDRNKDVINGKDKDNVVIYYYRATHPEDAVARILWFAGLYADEATAKAAMEWEEPGFTIDKVWFKAGTTLLSAIKMLCERCNFRFYFKHDGTPVFKAKISYSDLLTDGGLNLWDDATHLTEWSETVLGASTINREATEKVEGDYSCRINVDGDNSLSYIYQSFSMTALKRYKIIIWYKNSAVGKTARFRIKNTGNNVYLKSDGTWQAGEIYIALPNSIIWTPYELEFYAHASYSDYQILLRVLSAASSLIYFDNISIWREEFTFTEQKHIQSFSNYQDQGEIKNRIIIKGLKQAEPVNRDDAVPSELVGEAADDGGGGSIELYGERTLTITNHLFQTQTPLNDMCVSILADRKDPKWYTDVKVKWNPAPIELGDMIGWKERLSPTLQITQRGMVRDIKINKFETTYKCEKH